MSTNFYFGKQQKTKIHIGKRAAAGLYCWDCGITLCRGGNDLIHTSEADDWHETCPKCGKSYQKESLEESAAGAELGFNTENRVVKTGVASCCSFNWDMTRERFDELAKQKTIYDEYGKEYTLEQFLNELLYCPIQFFSMVGRGFS